MPHGDQPVIRFFRQFEHRSKYDQIGRSGILKSRPKQSYIILGVKEGESKSVGQKSVNETAYNPQSAPSRLSDQSAAIAFGDFNLLAASLRRGFHRHQAQYNRLQLLLYGGALLASGLHLLPH